MPPVLRNAEPDDSRFVLLPGPPPAPVKEAREFVAPAPRKTVPVADSDTIPPPRVDPAWPLQQAFHAIYPAEFEKDSGSFCQLQIGRWKQADALALLGAPTADRPAYDDDHAVNGRILAFADPTHRYRQMELDFDSDSGALRTVFLYPWNLTWQECRRRWDGDVSSADAAQGRKFYSYLHRRLDVLVDAAGKVISLGLY